ncbi:hypothetical protein OQA88_12727 [Cercophora sp. LCS_1]
MSTRLYLRQPLSALLHLRSGEATSPLKATISIVDLEDNPTFTALSYSWKRDIDWFNRKEANKSFNPPSKRMFSWLPGLYTTQRPSSTLPEVSANRPEEPRPVISNEKFRLDVYPNLWDALVQLRRSRSGVESTYWIDVVCINQEDLQERAKQVGMMDRIYWEARDVLVWLGAVGKPIMNSVKGLMQEDFGAGPEPGEKEVNELARRHVSDIVQGDDTKAQGRGTLRINVNFKGKQDIRRGINFVKKFAAVFIVISPRWFQRVWTVQEYLLSGKAIFLCGEAEFTPEQLERMMAWMFDPSRSLSLKIMSAQFSEFVGPQHGIRFESIPLMLNSGRKVTDVRDSAYAGLGVVYPDDVKIDQSIKEADGSQPANADAGADEDGKLRSKKLWSVLVPDCTVSTEEALLNLFACLLSHPDNITLLSYAGQTGEYIPSMSGMPRATLDFATGTRPSTSPSWHHVPSSLASRTQPPFKHIGGRFDACTSIPNQPRISANGKELSLLAQTIDTVRTGVGLRGPERRLYSAVRNFQNTLSFSSSWESSCHILPES